jgi:hypothetical protein
MVAPERDALIVGLRRKGWSQTKIAHSGLPSRASRRHCKGLLKASPPGRDPRG